MGSAPFHACSAAGVGYPAILGGCRCCALEEDAFLEAVTRARRDPDFALPGGESTNDVCRRAFAAFDAMARSTTSGVVVASTHGGVISIIRWELGGDFTVEEALATPMPAVFVLDQLQDGWRIESMA